MAEQVTTMQAKKEATPPVPVGLVKATDLLTSLEEISNSIARRAFEIFEGNGRMLGRDMENWITAESELLYPMRLDLTESAEGFTVQAEVPGFAAEQLQISLEGSRLTITGKREVKKEEVQGEKTIYREQGSDQLLRVVDLPAAVNVEKVKATLKDGILTLEMPKAAPAKAMKVEAKAA